MPGSYILRPVEAKLTHNTELLGKMSPYCSFQLGENVGKSNTCSRGGKNPHWGDAVTIPAPLNNDSLLTLQVMDKDKFTKDDQIGQVTIELSGLQRQGSSSKWYPLFHKDERAGEILLEASFQGQSTGLKSSGVGASGHQYSDYGATSLHSSSFNQGNAMNQSGFSSSEHSSRYFQEQQQSVESHTFVKEIDVVETVAHTQQVEVMEPVKIVKDVQYTKAVPVTQQIEICEPRVVKKEVEVIEPRLVTKTIQVIENVPVKKQVEVIESTSVMKEVQTFEPQTFTKQVQITDYVPVQKQVQVTEPVHLKKSIEFVEPVITTKTVTKEMREPCIISEDYTTNVGPATISHEHHLGSYVTNEGSWLETNEMRSRNRFSETNKDLREPFIHREDITKNVGPTTISGERQFGSNITNEGPWLDNNMRSRDRFSEVNTRGPLVNSGDITKNVGAATISGERRFGSDIANEGPWLEKNNMRSRDKLSGKF